MVSRIDSPTAIGRLTAALEGSLDRGGVLPFVAIAPVATARFLRDQCIQWAAALAYYSLVGLVPLLLALFSVIKGIGLHRGLTPFVMQTIGAGSPEVSVQIVRYIDQAQMRAVGVLSGIGALLAVFGILGNAEMCFNVIWGGVRGRSLRRKLRAYAAVALVGPLVLLLALAATAFFRRGTPGYAAVDSWSLGAAVFSTLRLLPYALLWGGFTLLYRFLPNTQVRLSSALLGAIVAGTLWQFAQWGYVTFVIGLVRYGGFYGALWQLPILLAWVYLAWAIVLFGAEVCRAHHEAVGSRITRRSAAPQTPDTARTE